MYKERIKSIVLVFLIITEIVLGSKILIDKKLWPNGYNFFSNIGDFYSDIIGYFLDNEEYKNQVFSPDKILINTGDQTTRLSLTQVDDGFFELYQESEKVLRSAFSKKQENMSFVSKEEVYKALSSDSLYLSYHSPFKTSVLSQMLNVSDNNVSNMLSHFTDIIIAHSPRTTVYVADFSNNEFLRINLSKNMDSLSELCEKYSNNNSNQVINYSFDLKFDQPFGDQKTTLNPLILIYSDCGDYPLITPKNPILDSDLSINDGVLSDILNVFGINPQTMNKYTEADGNTIVFVENDGILKISKDGFLEYESNGKGIKLPNKSSEYNDLSEISSFSYKINKAINQNAIIKLSSVDGSNYKFDYFVEGLPISINSEKMTSAVNATVSNGYITKYSQCLRSYYISDMKINPGMFLTALDNAIGEYSKSMNEIKIDKLFVGYLDDTSISAKNPVWIVSVDNVIATQ